MPTIDLTDDEHAAVTGAAIRRTIEEDKFPHAPRLMPPQRQAAPTVPVPVRAPGLLFARRAAKTAAGTKAPREPAGARRKNGQISSKTQFLNGGRKPPVISGGALGWISFGVAAERLLTQLLPEPIPARRR
jgi:hypothetical protein